MSSIPNRAMFFWAGGPLPWLRYLSLWSFKRLHPNWEVVLFLGDPAPFPPAQHPLPWPEKLDWMEPVPTQDYLPQVAGLGIEIKQWRPPAGYPGATPSHQNDLCRWGALSEFGGWFFDTDILFVERIETITESCTDLSTLDYDVAFIPAKDWIPTGFIGAAKGNKFTAACYVAAMHAPNKQRYRAAGSEVIARLCGLQGDATTAGTSAAGGEWYQHTKTQLATAMQKAFPALKWWMISPIYAYRWEWYDANQIHGADSTLPDKTVAIHWYGSQRVAQKAIRKITEQNFRGLNLTLPSYAKAIMDAERFAWEVPVIGTK